MTGLWLAQYRSQDSALGRWTSEDPSKFVDGPNVFSYVTNRPLTHIDPAGLQGAMVTDPKVIRTPRLPAACPPTACGCTIFQGDAGYSCSCAQGGYQLNLWAFFSATIYVNTDIHLLSDPRRRSRVGPGTWGADDRIAVVPTVTAVRAPMGGDGGIWGVSDCDAQDV